MIAARHRLGAAIGIPMMGNAVAAAAMHRLRGGPGQDLHLDLREAVHHINPSFKWKPTLTGEFPSVALLMDNPFGLIPYRTRDGRTVMASAVYPHQAAKWCRFLDIPPDFGKAATAFAGWNAVRAGGARQRRRVAGVRGPHPPGMAGSPARCPAGRPARHRDDPHR